MPIRSWAVGLFVIGGLILFTVLVFLIGDRQRAFSRHVDFATQFSNVNGLASGAKVRVSGVDAGKIKAITIPRDAAQKFRLDLEVEERVRGMIRTDSVVSIETEGVVGDKFVLVKRGSAQAEQAKAGAMLPSKEPLDLSAMMDRASGLLNDVHATVGDVRGRVNVALDSITRTVNHTDGLISEVRPQVRKIASDGGRITGNIDTMVADLNAGKGPAGLLLRDEQTRRQLQDTITNVKETSHRADEALARANHMIGDFEQRDLAAKTEATLVNVQALSQQLNTTIRDALAEDNMGEDGAANLRRTLTNLNRATANLAEDTQALKHNFFFRGFFKKRGFFDLDQITPAEYREACQQHKDFGTRMWLSAQTLFAASSNGKDELTPAGRGQIDAAIAPVLNTLSGHVIVVEGYDVDASPDRQFTASRWRADQVRRYLETHYHIRHSAMGIVAMGNQPPASAGRSSWDGAAIMVLDAKAH